MQWFLTQTGYHAYYVQVAFCWDVFESKGDLCRLAADLCALQDLWRPPHQICADPT